MLHLLLLLGLLGLSGAASQEPLKPVHVALLTDCSLYSDWQTVAAVWSFKHSGQPGNITRVMCCSPEEKRSYSRAMLREVYTHEAPSFKVNPVTKDYYHAYNKPGMRATRLFLRN